ncbi:MAG: 2-isopropylmalate synthase [Myxococcales bacterium]|nr:2-isopropylmalate synthase [Myxococcales bacterium]
MTVKNEWIYDWNDETADKPVFGAVTVDDETLRDGLQSPSVREPQLDEKIAILEAMISLGIRRGDIGLPMSSQIDDIRGLLRHIATERLPFRPGLAVRTVVSDIRHVADLQQQVGIPILAEAFVGCSRVRQLVEGWDLAFIVRKATEAVEFAKQENVPIMFVTEDTTRSHPDDLRVVYTAAIQAGANEVCIADTVGHATPWGTRAVVRAVRQIVMDAGGTDVLTNWHGHSDRGLGVINTIAAAEAGCDVLHATGLGVGERSGNTPMDQLLVNLKMLGLWEHDLQTLPEYVRRVSNATRIPVPVNYPVFGSDAFRTATGVHAAAIAKAMKRGDLVGADTVYSSVSASQFGLKQRIEIGRMSGKSNVLFWLENAGIRATESLVEAILTAAHESRTVLTDNEILEIVRCTVTK